MLPMPVARSAMQRPVAALSRGIMDVYKRINLKFCTERRRHMPGPKYNNGYDDQAGHYIPIIGEEIASRYTVQEVLGKGSFGVVLRCCDEKYQEGVAVKIIRSGAYFEAQGAFEAEVVAYLNRNPALANRIAQLRKAFLWQGHIVLVFELLSFNLYQLIKCTKYNGVSLDLTRKFAYQLLQVLRQLELHQPPIIHCDLKPENVVLRDPNRSGIRVIDFGSACYQQPQQPPQQQQQQHSHHNATTMARQGGMAAPVVTLPTYIQSRFYRSPEVILELGYTTAIDRWSLGCVLVELHTGVPLFPGRNEADMLARFTAVLGPLPSHMIARSPKRQAFYETTYRDTRERHDDDNDVDDDDDKKANDTAVAVTVVVDDRCSDSEAGSASNAYSNGNTLNDAAAQQAQQQKQRRPQRPRAKTACTCAAAARDEQRVHKRAASRPTSQQEQQQQQRQQQQHKTHTRSNSGSMPPSSVGVASAVSATAAGQPQRQQQPPAAQQQPPSSSTTTTATHASASPGAAAAAAAAPPMTRCSACGHDATASCWRCAHAAYTLRRAPDATAAARHTLADVLGVYDGGPRGCRRGQAGHDVASYLTFLDFVRRLLAYDPRERLGCADALQHPFLLPLRQLEASVAAQQQQQQQQQAQRRVAEAHYAASAATRA